MIIHDLDIARPVVGPTEADTPLHVDPNAVLLTGAAGLAVCFQPVARQCGHIAERLRAVQQGQSAHRLIRETAKRRRRRRRYRGPGFWPQPPGGIGSKSRRSWGHDRRDADRRPVVVASDAGPLCPCTTSRTGSRGPPPVWSLNTGPGTIQRRKGPRCARVRLSGPRSRAETGAGL